MGVYGDVRVDCILEPRLEGLLSIVKGQNVFIVMLILGIGWSVLLSSVLVDR